MDQIYTIDDYYDGPISGTASLNGRPHYYLCIFEKENDEYSKNYRLSPLSSEAFKLVQEQWKIWLRWNSTFEEGLISADTHPALPKDKERNNEIEKLISIEKNNCNNSSTIMLAKFVVPLKPNWASKWYVEWENNVT